MKKNLTFENASKRLDEILQQLSDEETPLETSLKLYAEAAEMISNCSGILKNAQMKVVEIDASSSGALGGDENDV